MAEEVEETEDEEAAPAGARSQLWKHEAQVEWYKETYGIDLEKDHSAAEIIAAAYATRVEWRKSDTYKELVAEYEAEKEEEKERKAAEAEERAAERKAKADEKAAKAKSKEGEDKPKPSGRKGAAKKAAAAKKAPAKKAARRGRGAKATSEDDPFE